MSSRRDRTRLRPRRRRISICSARLAGCFSRTNWSGSCRGLRGGPRLAEVNGAGAAGLDPIAATEAICLRLPGQGRQVLAAVHHARRLRCAHRRPLHAARRRRPSRQPAHRRRPPRGHLDRIVSQGVARSRRHSGRRRISLRPADAAHRAWRADGDQRRRLSDRPRLPPRQPRHRANSAPTRPPTSSTSWPTHTPS